jgi:hypothetical protein
VEFRHGWQTKQDMNPTFVGIAAFISSMPNGR